MLILKWMFILDTSYIRKGTTGSGRRGGHVARYPPAIPLQIFVQFFPRKAPQYLVEGWTWLMGSSLFTRVLLIVFFFFPLSWGGWEKGHSYNDLRAQRNLHMIRPLHPLFCTRLQGFRHKVLHMVVQFLLPEILEMVIPSLILIPCHWLDPVVHSHGYNVNPIVMPERTLPYRGTFHLTPIHEPAQIYMPKFPKKLTILSFTGTLPATFKQRLAQHKLLMSLVLLGCR